MTNWPLIVAQGEPGEPVMEVGQAELLDAARNGRILDGPDETGLGETGPDDTGLDETGLGGAARRPIDAALLRRCCLEYRDQIDPRGLRLRRVSVRGLADLAGLTVPFPIRFPARPRQS